MPRVNNVIQQVSQLNTYEQGKVFEFLNKPIISSVTTKFLEHPKETNPTFIIYFTPNCKCIITQKIKTDQKVSSIQIISY